MTKKRTRYDASAPETIRALIDTVKQQSSTIDRLFAALLGRGPAAPPSLPENTASAPAPSEDVAASRKPRKLTRRQREIVHLVMEGLSNEEIGERLQLSPDTVRSHRQNAYDRLGVHNVAELIAKRDEWE